MKILFVNACLRKGSRTHSLCQKYLDRFEKEVIEEVDLKKVVLSPLSGETLEKRNKDLLCSDLSSAEYDLARQFASADTIVIGAPYWDFSFPAILKTYFEHICVNNITFGYSRGVPIGLCKAENLVYITSAGGYILKNNSLEMYIGELCQMFGISDFRFYKAEGLDISGNNPDEIINICKASLER